MPTKTTVRKRIYRTCKCGNELSIPPNKRGQTVLCMDCGNELVALEPEKLEELENKRDRTTEHHIKAISIWLSTGGILLAVIGSFYLLKKEMTFTLSPLLETTQGGALMIFFSGFLFWLSPSINKHEEWARKSVAAVLASVSILMGVGIGLGYLAVTPVSIGVIAWNLFSAGILVSEGGKGAFLEDYRHLMATDPPNIIDALKSYLFWIPMAIIVLGLI